MAEAELIAQQREKKGKQAAKHLRQEGFIPGILYGPGEKPAMLTVINKELLNLLHTYGRNVIVNLHIGDEKKNIKAFIYDIQHDPLSGKITHVDLKHINLKEKIRLSIPIRLEGLPVGVKNEGGILEHTLHALEIECLPADIPERIMLDVTELSLGDGIHVSDIEEKNFEILIDKSTTVVHVVAPKVVAEVGEEVEEELLEETGEAEGPEVIGEEE